MNKSTTYLIASLVVSIVLNIILGILLWNKKTLIEPVIVKTTDTVVIDSLHIIEKTELKYVTLFDTAIIYKKDIVNDTVYDTIKISLPIEHKTYKDIIDRDSITYNLQIDYSGYKASLDSINLTSTFTREEIKIIQPKKWRQSVIIGPSVGFGFTFFNNGNYLFGPYVGVSVSYGFGYTW